jgi:ribosomal protein S8
MVPSSKFKKFVLDAMEREGFIAGYEVVKNQIMIVLIA